MLDAGSWMGIQQPASSIHHPGSTTRRLDFDIHTGRQAQLIERFDRLGRGLNDIDQPLVRANFKLLPGFLIYVRAAKHRVAFDSGRQWNGSMHDRIGPLSRIDDLRRALIEHRMIVRFHTDANYFLRSCHV